MTRPVPRTVALGLTVGALICLVSPVVAQDEQPEPEPELPLLGRATQPSGSTPQSLAEIAATIKLQQPPDEQEIVISDSNLRQVGNHGWLSVSGAGAPDLEIDPAADNEEASKAWEERYNEQAEAVKRLEDYLQDVDTTIESVPDPYRQGRGPHSYAPGQMKPGQVRRNEVEAELALERARLDRLRSQGQRLGVTPDWYQQQEKAEE